MTKAGRRCYFFFEALFLAVLRPPLLRPDDFFAARFVDFFAARFFVAPLRAPLRAPFFVARFLVAPLRAPLRAVFFAARFFVDFFAARFLVDFLAADFFGAALRFFAFFFGAAAGAEGVIIDIMSAIIFASPV
ncbi:MAG TPA: hypothetical protein VLI21_06605 [Casimicrobiaceae bacterium]|nr:hypothetical protein [Casimicrobiaceae bacterium]